MYNKFTSNSSSLYLVNSINLDLIEEFSSLSIHDQEELVVTSRSGRSDQTTHEHSHAQQQMPNTSHSQWKCKKPSRLIETIKR
jgi:predicted alpha/beta superfamily hydrolase